MKCVSALCHRACRVEDKTLGPGGAELPADTQYMAIVKGAPNMVLSHCTQWLQADGTFADFSEEDKEGVLDVPLRADGDQRYCRIFDQFS